MTTTLYGIKNCDTIKKARRFLRDHDIDYEFHDYRQDGTNKALVAAWVKKHGWETVLNKRGTTWRRLDKKVQESTNDKNAVDLLVKNPAMIKRPVLVVGKASLVGFKPDDYKAFLKI